MTQEACLSAGKLAGRKYAEIRARDQIEIKFAGKFAGGVLSYLWKLPS
jgi:hypothetical protein